MIYCLLTMEDRKWSHFPAPALYACWTFTFGYLPNVAILVSSVFIIYINMTGITAELCSKLWLLFFSYVIFCFSVLLTELFLCLLLIHPQTLHQLYFLRTFSCMGILSVLFCWQSPGAFRPTPEASCPLSGAQLSSWDLQSPACLHSLCLSPMLGLIFISYILWLTFSWFILLFWWSMTCERVQWEVDFFERLPVKNVFISPVRLIICLGIASNVIVEKPEAILAPDL